MENNKDLKKTIKKILIKDSEKLPFIAQLWEIEIYNSSNENKDANYATYGHYNTKSYNSVFFYKPISKIIDFSALNE